MWTHHFFLVDIHQEGLRLLIIIVNTRKEERATVVMNYCNPSFDFVSREILFILALETTWFGHTNRQWGCLNVSCCSHNVASPWATWRVSRTDDPPRNNRPIYMVVLASAVEGSFVVKRAQCNWTKTRTLQLCVYMRFRTTGLGVLCCWL